MIVWETRLKAYPPRMLSDFIPGGIPESIMNAINRNSFCVKQFEKKTASGEFRRKRKYVRLRDLFDPGGKGREIVRELRVCPECAGRFPRRNGTSD
jgi:hypothetical protein